MLRLKCSIKHSVLKNEYKKFDFFLEILKPYHQILRLGDIKEVIRMSDEAIRELFCTFVEEGKLDEEIAEQILQRILEILFGEKADRSPLRQFQEKERKHT